MTDTSPDVASAGTTAVICASESTANTAQAPLKLTATARRRWLPVSVTVVPGTPAAGATTASTGAGTK